MANQYYKNQEQDDLMADFDAPRKELRKSSLERRRGNNFHISDRKQVLKPTLKTNFFQQTEVPKASLLYDQAKAAGAAQLTYREKRKLFNEKENTDHRSSAHKLLHYEDSSAEVSQHYQGVSTDDLEDDYFTAFNFLLEEIQKFMTEKAGMLRKIDFTKDLGPISRMLEINVIDIMREVPKYEEELKYFTAAALVCYGGSWTKLAGILAAAEAFEIRKVVEEAKLVGVILSSEGNDSEHDISPEEIKACVKNVGLHFSLLIAVVFCPSWAEICISIAFALKFTTLISADDLRRKTLSTRAEVIEYYDQVNPEWFDLFTSVACVIVSLIVFGFFPRLITAMYMGYIGLSLTAEAFSARSSLNIPFVLDSEDLFSKSTWMERTTQYYVWAFVSFMAVWQSMSGYSGVFEFISWLMFLLPVVHVHNIIYGEPLCDETDEAKKTE